MKNFIVMTMYIFTLSSCSSYNEDIEKSFMEGCKVNATEVDCKCLYDELIEKIPYEDFIEASQHIETSNVKPEFAEHKKQAVKKCIKESTPTETN